MAGGVGRRVGGEGGRAGSQTRLVLRVNWAELERVSGLV